MEKFRDFMALVRWQNVLMTAIVVYIKKNLIEKNEDNFLRNIYTKSNPE